MSSKETADQDRRLPPNFGLITRKLKILDGLGCEYPNCQDAAAGVTGDGAAFCATHQRARDLDRRIALQRATVRQMRYGR
jgi:hypothetical protein